MPWCGYRRRASEKEQRGGVRYWRHASGVRLGQQPNLGDQQNGEAE